jgi:hypothetical protein
MIKIDARTPRRTRREWRRDVTEELSDSVTDRDTMRSDLLVRRIAENVNECTLTVCQCSYRWTETSRNSIRRRLATRNKYRIDLFIEPG